MSATATDGAPRIEETIRRIVLGYRVVGVVWAALVTGARLSAGDLPVAVGVAVVAIAACWTAMVAWRQRHGARLDSTAFLAADLAVAAATVILPASLDVGGAAGGYPFAAVLHAAAVTGIRAGLAAAAALGLLSAGAPVAVGDVTDPATIEVAVFYLASAAVIGWGGHELRAAESARRTAEQARADEEAARLLAEERAATAAHLHDSVLQTLALMRRSREDPDVVQQLAHRQERELRAWLFDAEPEGDATLRSLLSEHARRVEGDHPMVRVEVVAVGDRPADAAASPLVDAAAEAIRNAAVHSGADVVDVYLEVGREEAVAHVRDRGTGFDLEAVPADRQGLAESVVGRLERAGGSAEVRTAPGEGCDVRLWLPLTAATAPEEGDS